MVKITEIYRFSHNWMGSRDTKRTLAMKLGLARGKVYPRGCSHKRKHLRPKTEGATSTVKGWGSDAVAFFGG
jgi:hypothetical protein